MGGTPPRSSRQEVVVRAAPVDVGHHLLQYYLPQPVDGGTDNLKTSIGHGWNPVQNLPTVYNSSLAIARSGRPCGRPQEQAGGPIQAGVEMNMPHTLAVGILQSIPATSKSSSRYGKNKIDIDMITDSIAEFEKTLVTPDSRFDRAQGDDKALSEKELAGYTLFAKESGCVACHNGPGGRRHVIPAHGRGRAVQERLARRRPPGGHRCRCRPLNFKVPTLRNAR